MHLSLLRSFGLEPELLDLKYLMKKRISHMEWRNLREKDERIIKYRFSAQTDLPAVDMKPISEEWRNLT